MSRRKTIALPGLHDLDISSILPIVNSRAFQRLRYCKQLGASYLVFPCANHTRFEHALGTFSLTQERTTHWQEDGVISKEEARSVSIFGLLHDIGHGPYSHATENLYELDHNKNGLQVLQQLRPEIESCEGNFFLIKSLFERTHPYAACVSHRPLGTDKLDYLQRDARYTTEAVAFRMGDILNHVHYSEEQLGIDLNIVPEVMQVQRDYVNAHDRVYFRKGATIAQYFLQQIIARAIASNDIQREELPTLRDNELDAKLLQASDTTVKQLFHRFLDRDLPKAAILLRPQTVRTLNRNHGKLNTIFHVPMKVLHTFSKCEKREIAVRHETRIAALANIPAADVLLTPVPHPHRFIPDNVQVYDGSEKIGTLREIRPQHYQSLEETTLAYASVMVCVPKEYRGHVCSQKIAQTIFEYLENQTAPET